MGSVCSRRGLQCRLHVKNEASAVQSSPAVVEVRGCCCKCTATHMPGLPALTCCRIS